MKALETLIRMVTDAAPQTPGLQMDPRYILLNLALPILLGFPLAWTTKLLEKALNRLLGEKR